MKASAARESAPQKAMRIWAQSASDLSVHTLFGATIAQHGRRVCQTETQIDVHGLAPGTYPPGMTATEICCEYPVTHHMLSLQVMENALLAEREGYDAMVVTSFMDHGCELARSAVDIPVVGLGSTALRVASAAGRALGLVSHDADQRKVVRNLIHYHGFDKNVRLLAALDPGLSTEDLDAGMNGSPVLLQRFSEQIDPFIKAGVDLIVPAEGFLAGALYLAGVREVRGIPVFDGLGAAFAFAEMMVRLRRHAGLEVSRSGDYAKAPVAALDHVRAVTMGAMQAAQGRG